MNIQEIKDSIAAKIAGQGNQVDIGNALPEILNALCDLIPSGEDVVEELTLEIESQNQGDQNLTKEEFLVALDITEEQANALFSGKFKFIKSGNYILPFTMRNDSGVMVTISFGFSDYLGDTEYWIDLWHSGDSYGISVREQ